LWYYIGGLSTGLNDEGSYGAKGLESSATWPPSRFSAATAVDNNNNLYLFGGSGNDVMNDLFYFNTTSKLWAWISGNESLQAQYGAAGIYVNQGQSTTEAYPGARGGSTIFFDSTYKNLYMFGGLGYSDNSTGSHIYLNDFWSYQISTGYWTWIGGGFTLNGQTTGNAWPGARSLFAFINYNDVFYLFGGRCYDLILANVAPCDDLWTYTTNWTLVQNRASSSQGVYGNIGEANGANHPGGRLGFSYTVINSGLWLWGGEGIGEDLTLGYLNDLWELDLSSLQWIYWDGNTTVDVDTITNYPGNRVGTTIDMSSNPLYYCYLGGLSITNVYYNERWCAALPGTTPTAPPPPTPPPTPVSYAQNFRLTTTLIILTFLFLLL